MFLDSFLKNLESAAYGLLFIVYLPVHIFFQAPFLLMMITDENEKSHELQALLKMITDEVEKRATKRALLMSLLVEELTINKDIFLISGVVFGIVSWKLHKSRKRFVEPVQCVYESLGLEGIF